MEKHNQKYPSGIYGLGSKVTRDILWGLLGMGEPLSSRGEYRSVGDCGGVLIEVPASTGLEQFAFIWELAWDCCCNCQVAKTLKCVFWCGADAF